MRLNDEMIDNYVAENSLSQSTFSKTPTLPPHPYDMMRTVRPRNLHNLNTTAWSSEHRGAVDRFAARTLKPILEMREDEVLRRRKFAAFLYEFFFRTPEQRLWSLMGSVVRIIERDLETDWENVDWG